jgi:hypothetical protein
MDSVKKLKVPNFYILVDILSYNFKESIEIYLFLLQLSKRTNKFI